MSAVLRNPVYFIFLIMLGVAAYVTYTMNLWGPMLRMANAASTQGLEIFKEKLREFLESSETGRQAIGMSAKPGNYRYVKRRTLTWTCADNFIISIDTLHTNGTTKSKASSKDDEVDEI